MAEAELTADQIKENLEDFDDFDTEIENLLEAEFEEVYQEALDAALVYIKQIGNLPPTVVATDRRVLVLVNRAERTFHKIWAKKAGKLLLSEIEFAMRRGVVQMNDFNDKILENKSNE